MTQSSGYGGATRNYRYPLAAGHTHSPAASAVLRMRLCVRGRHVGTLSIRDFEYWSGQDAFVFRHGMCFSLLTLGLYLMLALPIGLYFGSR
jgi:hypothetical protein